MVVLPVLLGDDITLAVLRDAREAAAPGVVGVARRKAVLALLDEAAEVVVPVRLLRLAARVLREAVPLVVGESLYLAVSVIRADKAPEIVVLARNAPIFAAVPLGDDFLDEPEVVANIVS